MTNEGERPRLERLDIGQSISMAGAMRASMGPCGPDGAARSLISTVWRMLPEDARSPERVEAESRRLLDRALAEYQEDSRAFGFESEG